MRVKQARTWMFVAMVGVLVGGIRPAFAQRGGEVLVYGIYDNREDAHLALNTLLQLRQTTNVRFGNYAAIYKDPSGQVLLLDSPRQRPEGGAIAGGAVIGGLVGLLGGPVGVLVGAGVGAGVGAATSASALGIPQADINRIRTSLQPGHAAVFVMTNQRFAPSVASALAIEPQAFPQAPAPVQTVPVQPVPVRPVPVQPPPQMQECPQMQCPQMQCPQMQQQELILEEAPTPPQERQEYILEETVPQRQQQELILEETPAPQMQCP